MIIKTNNSIGLTVKMNKLRKSRISWIIDHDIKPNQILILYTAVCINPLARSYTGLWASDSAELELVSKTKAIVQIEAM